MKKVGFAFIILYLALMGGGYLVYHFEWLNNLEIKIKSLLFREQGEIAQAEPDSQLVALLTPIEENFETDLIVPEFDLPSEILPEEYVKQKSDEPQLAVIFRGLDRATISSKVNSTVLGISHRMGERFRKGELLVRLDDTIFVGLKEKALGNLAKARAETEAKEQLFKQDIASAYEVKVARANVAVAISDLITAQYSIDACHVMAPYDGKVVSLFVEEHEQIQEGKPMIEIVNDLFLIGQVLAPASIISSIRLGQPVDIFVREIGTKVTGKILRIDAVIDPASSTFKVDLLVDNQMGALRVGMIGEVVFKSQNSYSQVEPQPAEKRPNE